MDSAGGSHKPPYHVARRSMQGERERERTFAPGQRVVIRASDGVPSRYNGRLGEVIEKKDTGAGGDEAIYVVQLDVMLPNEEPGPVEFFTSELTPTRLPKAPDTLAALS